MKLTLVKEPAFEAVNLCDILRDVLITENLPPGIEVAVNCDADVSVSGDRVQLRMAFRNIVANAVQAVGGQGRLECSAVTENDTAVITISDNGPGIPHENLKSIFEPFFTTKSNGFGLGLALVKLIVERNRGDVTVLSEPGNGAAFVIRLPLAGGPVKNV